MLALGLALGSIVLGHLILVPALQGDTSLVDANLARALAQPLSLRTAELALAACVVLTAVAKHWLRHNAAASLALLAAGIAGVDRLGILPRAHEAWSRVDLVAMRPQVRIDAAEQLWMIHEATLAALAVVLLALAAFASTAKPKSRSE
ncbi:hypothetical protein ENSA7_06730 [Enhygromyxa salina]|uniref:DUF4149 domain-containing protein n=2 Tax=Enhygromyxa salina TaxID=215803 RepID=A0A2S9YX02_9BACT|nr:hypothetical protein ENSA7_06730 [Enhygromyxa salina]